MWVPKAFEVTDEDELYGVIERHGFATIVSVDGALPTATLAPFVVSHESGRRRVWGHLARANPQAKTLGDAAEILVIFRGPDTYVSPSWYATTPNVPTWNFVVVHAYGIPRVLPREDPRVRWVLERTVERFESDLEEPWALDGPEEYLASLSKGVVAFELDVTSLQGQFKLSQNHPQDNRLGVIRNLERGGDAARAVAQLMTALEERA
jgi:transcriptional regulator